MKCEMALRRSALRHPPGHPSSLLLFLTKNVATNSMAGATYFENGVRGSFTLLTVRFAADQFSLIIPNAAMPGPPTSGTVLANLGMSIGPAAHGLPLQTELET